MNIFSSKRSLASGISVAAVAAALCMAAPASAQTLSTIRGEHATPGSTVTVTDNTTGQKATATVKPDGTFAIVGLRPSTYHIAGAGPEQDLVLPVGQTITIDAAPPAPTEAAPAGGGAIVVTGHRDRKEVRTATVSTNVSTEQMNNLPQNDRNFLNFAALAPGVQVTPSGQDKRIQAGAVSGDQVNVFIDGLSFKNPVNHGGIAGQNFSQGNPFPQLAVQEFKVDTQNFKAEYEQAGSAIITAVTKTGGTEFHGDVFGQFQPKAFVAEPFFSRGDDTKPDYHRWQFGGDLGGPIIPEKLHFFLAYEGTRQSKAGPTVIINPALAGQDIADQFNGDFPEKFNQDLYFGKLTAFVTDDDTVDLSAFIRKEDVLRDFGGIRAAEAGHRINSDGKLFQLDWKHRGDNWLNELTIAYNTFENGTPRVIDGPQVILRCQSQFDNTDPDNPVLLDPCAPGPGFNGGGDVAIFGANEFLQNDRQKSWTFKDNATLELGEHIIKGGVKVSFNKLERAEDLLSNASYRFNATDFTTFDASAPFEARVSTVDVVPASAKDTMIGLFIQDDWSPDEHWTVNAGLRWDWESDAKNEDFVTPPDVAAALRAYPGWQAAGIDPEDYISNGHNRKPFWGAFQPRLGVSYDVRGDRDLIFFAGAGRYYDRPLFITAGIETIKNLYQRTPTVSFCDPGGFPNLAPCPAILPAGTIPFNPSLLDPANLRSAVTATGLGGEIWLLNNKTKLPYSDQFSLGVRKRFGDWQTSLTFSHIRSHNIFKFVRGNRFSNGWFSRVLQRADVDGDGTIEPDEVIGCTDGGTNWVIDNFPAVDYPACPATQGLLPGHTGKLNIGTNNGTANYNALFFQAEKPYTKASGWGVTAALTLQRARTNVGTELTGDEFFAGPDQTQFGWQYSQGVPKWSFAGTGIVGLPLDMTFATTVIMNGGPSFGDITFGTPNTPDQACCVVNLGGVHFPEKNIAYKTVDIRLAKTFKMPWGHELTADFQVFNLFDWVNRSYSAWGAGSHNFGQEPTLEERGTVGTARAFQAGLKYSF